MSLKCAGVKNTAHPHSADAMEWYRQSERKLTKNSSTRSCRTYEWKLIFLFSIFVSIFFSSNFSASCQVHQAEMNFRVWRAFLALFRSRVAFAYTIFWQLWLWRRYRQSYRIDSIRWLATSERKKENNQNKLEIAMSNGRKKRKSERAGEKIRNPNNCYRQT